MESTNSGPRLQIPWRSEDTAQSLVRSTSNDRQIIMRGPGTHIFKAFSAGGSKLEKICLNLVRASGWGPKEAADKVVTYLGSGDECLRKLDELYLWRKEHTATSVPQKRKPKEPDVVKTLKKLCRDVIDYARGTQTPVTQTLAFKNIIMLMTRYNGLRWVFLELLTKDLKATPSQSDLSSLWRKVTSSGDPDWEFFLNYAAYCITSSDKVTIDVEEHIPSQFGCSQCIGCLSESLSRSIKISQGPKDLSRLAAVRYLSGTLWLDKFWKERIYNDPQAYPEFRCKKTRQPGVSDEKIEVRCVNLSPFVNNMCGIGKFLLEDLSVDGEQAVTRDDLLTLDIEGIHDFLKAFWIRLGRALELLPPDGARTEESLKLVSDFGDLLQSQRSQYIFPAASKAALGVLKSIRESAEIDPQAEIPPQGRVSSVCYSPDGRFIVAGSYDGTLRVWNAETGTLVTGPIEGHTGDVNSVSFSPDGRLIASGSDGGTVRVWDAQTGALVTGPFEGHRGPVYSVSFSPDGRLIASGSSDNTLRVWDAQTGALVTGPIKGHTDEVNSVSFSPDGRLIASGSSDNTLRVWDAQTGALVTGPFGGHTGTVRSVSFSPDGRLIASGSDDNTLRVWDAQTGALVTGPFEGHTEDVNSVSFSPDGRLIASGSWDHTLRVWDAQTGALVTGPFEGHTDTVYSVSFSPDGRSIASGSMDKTVRIWDAETGGLLLTVK